MHHHRCVDSITKNFSCITLTVEHNYISSSSAVEIYIYIYIYRAETCKKTSCIPTVLLDEI